MLRYRGLGYVALNVSDIKRSRRFYEEIVGLQFSGEHGDGGVVLKAGDHQHLILHHGENPGLKSLGWRLEDESQLDVLTKMLRRHDLSWAALPARRCRALGVSRGVRISEPHTGATLDFFASPGPTPRSPMKGPVDGLGHAVLRVFRYRPAVRFFEEVLNFQRSDEVDGWISFLRCFPNPLHHSIGLANGARNMLHHVNFIVRSAEDVKSAAERFQRAAVPIMSGPGRHPPSGSTFLYFLDPDGITLEYGHGMERFPEEAPRAPRVLPAVPESLDFDANVRDPRIYAIGEIETMSL